MPAQQANRTRAYYALKRALDIAGAVILAPIAAPVVAAAAVLIWLDDRGPVFFVQERFGARRVRRGREWVWEPVTFPLVKLRSMRVDADPDVHRRYMDAYIAGDDAGMRAQRPDQHTYKMVEDPRITRAGHLLRRVSIDELPQLWNVLRGEMSLVGPRPPLPYEVAKYGERDLRRFAARPGITGWWQVNGRSTTTFEQMIQLDLEYVDKQSLWLDMRIVARTLPATVSMKGAG